jgi:hypothetical protein
MGAVLEVGSQKSKGKRPKAKRQKAEVKGQKGKVEAANTV